MLIMVILLLLIPIAVVCLVFVIKFNGYLYKNYPNIGRTSAWNVSHIAVSDPSLAKLAKHVRISLYAVLTASAIFLLCGAGIAAVGT
jgi:hypothetical protein